MWGKDIISFLAEATNKTQTLCLIEMIEASTCSLTNQTCVCTNVELVNAITLFVAQNCTIREQLGRNIYKQSDQYINFNSCAEVL
jgi:hypothetical protein